MSKLKYIFFVFVTLFGAVTMLSSCSSSDDNEFKQIMMCFRSMVKVMHVMAIAVL